MLTTPAPTLLYCNGITEIFLDSFSRQAERYSSFWKLSQILPIVLGLVGNFFSFVHIFYYTFSENFFEVFLLCNMKCKNVQSKEGLSGLSRLNQNTIVEADFYLKKQGISGICVFLDPHSFSLSCVVIRSTNFNGLHIVSISTEKPHSIRD